MGLIEGEGTREDVWQRWLPKPEPQADAMVRWLRQDQRLVVLAPHPDDEVLACGGLLAMHRARGGACLVIALTDGEASDPALSAIARQRLGRQRRAESEAGLARLAPTFRAEAAKASPAGLEVVRLGLPDGYLAKCSGVLLGALAHRLGRHDLLLSTWRHDGHPDHEAAGRCAAQAAADAGLRHVEAPVWMWHWATPDDARVPWSRLIPLPLSDGARRCKQAALAEHRSQLRPRSGGAAPVLGAHDAERARRPCEHFFV